MTAISDYEKTIKANSKTFYLSSKLLPNEIRDKIIFLYHICRVADDIADKSTDSKTDKYMKLDMLLVNNTIKEFFNKNDISLIYYSDLIDGIKSDLDFKQPMDFPNLYNYCYKVAGTVGIMSARIFNVTDKNVLLRAERLGVAMQLTNILRDIKEDKNQGRIYLSEKDLTDHSVTAEDIINEVYTEKLVALLTHYEMIARRYYIEGNSGIKGIGNYRIRVAVKTASTMYEGILNKLKSNKYNPFKERIYVGNLEKVYYLLSAIIQ